MNDETQGTESLLLAEGTLVSHMFESLDTYKAASLEKEDVAGDNSVQDN